MPVDDVDAIGVRLSELSLRRLRQWGACWLALQLWQELELDSFWRPRFARAQGNRPWLKVLKTLVAYRLIDPGSEWRLHRKWFDASAMADLLDSDFALAEKNTLYRCLVRIVEHKDEPFKFLVRRWGELFGPTHPEVDALASLLMTAIGRQTQRCGWPLPTPSGRRPEQSRCPKPDARASHPACFKHRPSSQDLEPPHISRRHHPPCRRMREVCAENQRSIACATREEVAPCRARELAIGVEVDDAIGLAALDRVMHQIARDHRLLAIGLDANADVARSVPGVGSSQTSSVMR